MRPARDQYGACARKASLCNVRHRSARGGPPIALIISFFFRVGARPLLHEPLPPIAPLSFRLERLQESSAMIVTLGASRLRSVE
eukprot:2535915-Pyramimonas_sp.AAC.2